MSMAQMQRGFTLVEIVVVVAVILVLTGLAVVGFGPFRANADLNGAQDIVLAALRTARSRTLASEDLSVHGVHFEPSRLVVFQGSTYAGATATEPHAIASSVTLQNIDLSSWPDVTFARITGESSGVGTIQLQHSSDRARTVVIREFSELSLPQGLPNQLDTRVSDTRHVHFDLGWSLQDMETLVLTFMNNEGIPVVQSITMAPFFSGNPLTFRWEGSFMIDGMVQRLHIHTHLLTPTDTVLSVHRNRFENTKPLTLSFSSVALGVRNVATYSSAGILTVGPDGGTAIVQ